MAYYTSQYAWDTAQPDTGDIPPFEDFEEGYDEPTERTLMRYRKWRFEFDPPEAMLVDELERLPWPPDPDGD